MERQEIEAELNEVERDLSDIARRAHIAASNLTTTAVGCGWSDEAKEYREVAARCREIEANADALQMSLRQTRASYRHHPDAAGEGGAA